MFCVTAVWSQKNPFPFRFFLLHSSFFRKRKYKQFQYLSPLDTMKCLARCCSLNFYMNSSGEGSYQMFERNFIKSFEQMNMGYKPSTLPRILSASLESSGPSWPWWTCQQLPPQSLEFDKVSWCPLYLCIPSFSRSQPTHPQTTSGADERFDRSRHREQ